jgi:hypothetical protein
MKMDAELNSQNTSAAVEIDGQGQASEQASESIARPAGSEAATSTAPAAVASGEGSLATGAPDEGHAKAVIVQPVEPAAVAEKISPAGDAGRDNQVGGSQVGGSQVGGSQVSAPPIAVPPVAIASSDAAPVGPLGNALAALDRRDYATAKRLFDALGRKDAVEAIDTALAALDRKDYATAQGLFEALAPLKPAAPVWGPTASDSWNSAQHEPEISPLKVVPLADEAFRQPAPQAKKPKRRVLKPLLLVAGLALFSVFGASALYGSRSNWTFAATKSQAIAGLASAVDLIKAPLATITGASGREEERSAMRDLSAALTQVTIRLDQIEHDYGARLDQLGERVDQNSSSSQNSSSRQDSSPGLADIAARLDGLEKKAAAPATPVSELADVVARLDRLEKRVAVAAAPASEIADITTRLNKLEKKAALPTLSSTKPLPPAGPKQSTLMARAEPPASNEIAKQRPLLREYNLEDVQNGVAVVDSRYGPQQVAPGDFIPGAGRVLRIERRGDDWFVLTSQGIIASDPTQY